MTNGRKPVDLVRDKDRSHWTKKDFEAFGRWKARQMELRDEAMRRSAEIWESLTDEQKRAHLRTSPRGPEGDT